MYTQNYNYTLPLNLICKMYYMAKILWTSNCHHQTVAKKLETQKCLECLCML